MASPKVQVKSADMQDDTREEIIALTREAMASHDQEKDIAQSIKLACDKKFGPYWHCIVGSSFGSFVTHGEHLPLTRHMLMCAEAKFFLYFYIDSQAVLIFKTK